MNAPDAFDLRRFGAAQDAGGSYRSAVAELRAGRKTGHWIWYVFPQIAGLGQSPTSKQYAIRSVDEARAYLAHPVLGLRLLECAGILLSGRTAEDILGGIDAMKLRSSMTLFLHAAPDEPAFSSVLGQYFGGVPDPATEQLIRQTGLSAWPPRPSTPDTADEPWQPEILTSRRWAGTTMPCMRSRLSLRRTVLAACYARLAELPFGARDGLH